MKILANIIELFGIGISLFFVFFDNAAQLPFVLHLLAPNYELSKRSVDHVFSFTVPDHIHHTNDLYFKEFEEFIVWGLSTLDFKERRTNIAPGSISFFEYAPRGLPVAQDIEGDALSNFIKMPPHPIVWNKANIQKALQRQYDESIGKYRLPLGLAGVIVTLSGFVLKLKTEKRNVHVTADGAGIPI
jgi:hypothetical protein